MTNKGSYPIWLTGSCKTVWRVVYVSEHDGAMFIKWYGQYIGVERGMGGYFHTIEQY